MHALTGWVMTDRGIKCANKWNLCVHLKSRPFRMPPAAFISEEIARNFFGGAFYVPEGARCVETND